MTTGQRLLQHFGDPSKVENERKYMVLKTVPPDIREAIPVLKERIYLNKAISEELFAVLQKLIEQGLHKEIKTYHGCFDVRPIRGGKEWSIHSWGLAVDFNAQDNPLGGDCNWSKEFLEVWKSSGWTLGADFTRKDAMHFEYTKV